MRVSEKTMENYERLGRKARSGIELGTSLLPVLRAQPLGHWWGLHGMRIETFLNFIVGTIIQLIKISLRQ